MKHTKAIEMRGIPAFTTKEMIEAKICPKCRKLLVEYISKRTQLGQLISGKRDYSFVEGVSSKYKGVMFAKWRNKWRARIKITSLRTGNHSMKHLGYFYSEIEAAIAYDIAAQEKYGDVVIINSDLYPEDFS